MIFATIHLPSSQPCHSPSHFSSTLSLSQQMDRNGLKTAIDIYEEPCITAAELSEFNNKELLKTNVNCQVWKALLCTSILCPNCTIPFLRDIEQSK